ncbi:MAG: aminoglycoside phosphotransferase family protein [Methanoregula sp.]|jgi:aminoglycoside phosphotransferase (APT) family kinase protein
MDVQETPDAFCAIERQLASITRFTGVHRIARGFSFEQKYLLECGNRQYLARIVAEAGPAIIAAKKAEFEIIRSLKKYSAFVPDAYAFGTSDDRSVCFMVLGYIPGTDGEEALQGLCEADQYRLGIMAGKELINLHAMPAPAGLPDWYEAVRRKYFRKCAAFGSCGLELPGIDLRNLTDFITKNTACIRGTRRVFLHDDYHPANLVVADAQLVGIIDFNRYDWGDPVHDFVKTAFFTRAISVPFAAGLVEGYNGGSPPPEFWKRYALYCAMALVPDLLWSHDYEAKTGKPGEVERATKRIRMVYEDHEGFATDIPRWYRGFAGQENAGRPLGGKIPGPAVCVPGNPQAGNTGD